MWPGDPYARHLGEASELPGGGVPVHASPVAVEQDRAGRSGTDGAVDGPSDCWRQRDQDDFVAFAADSQYPVAVFFAEITDICAAGFEDPQAQEAQHGH